MSPGSAANSVVFRSTHRRRWAGEAFFVIDTALPSKRLEFLWSAAEKLEGRSAAMNSMAEMPSAEPPTPTKSFSVDVRTRPLAASPTSFRCRRLDPLALVSLVPERIELHRRQLAGSNDDLEQQRFRVVLGKEPTRGEDEVPIGEHVERHIEFGDGGGDQSSAVRLGQIAVDRPKF